MRNPFTREVDTFRLLVTVAIAAGLVIAVALVAGETAGALVGLVVVCVGVFYGWRWMREALGTPDEDE